MSTYEISKSSLLSLKAEILRKQQELTKAKADNEVKIKIIKKNTPLEIKNKGVDARSQKDIPEVDEDLLKQSRSILEYKSMLYDKLSSGKLTEEEKEHKKRFLVRFDKKNRAAVNDVPPSDSEDDIDKYPESEEDCYNTDEDDNKNPDEKWVDYVDCLGRTRKCLQKDLVYLKTKDEELKQVVEAKKRRDGKKVENDSSAKDEMNNKDNVHTDITKDKETLSVDEESELLSSDMRREILRRQWEKEEEELKNKSNIHYQDVLFGEARTHGVGYYGFSKDEEERIKQQEALRKLREETEQKQQKAQELKNIRERQLAARIKAAKERRRVRMGLPPESDEPEPAPKLEIPDEEKKKQDTLKQEEQEKERLLEEARKRHIRPWDIGKEGVKKHYEMTQEEWVEKKRSERTEEFAPPSAYRKEFRSHVEISETPDTDKSLTFTTKKLGENKPKHRRKRRRRKSNSVLNSAKNSDEDITPAHEKTDQNVSHKSTPIINLCEETDFDDQLLEQYRKIMRHKNEKCYDGNSTPDLNEGSRGKGVEIAPPPTFDYYGPSFNKIPKISKPTSIFESVEAGLKYLRKQVEEKEKGTKHAREMDFT